MKKFILDVLLFIPLFALGQSEYPVFRKDTLYINPYDFYVKGSKLKTGLGTMPDGSFKYITTSPGSFVALMGATSANPSAGITPLGSSYSGHTLEAKKYKRLGSKKRGFKYYLVAGGGNIVNYWVDIESALKTGEIVSNSPNINKAANASVADEIKKLKELLDSGAITEEEYNNQKKKLFNL